MIFKEFPIRVNGSLEYARLTVYILDTPGKSIDLKLENRPMVLLCPGGGYAFTSFREAEPLAISFLSKGYIIDHYLLKAIHYVSKIRC